MSDSMNCIATSTGIKRDCSKISQSPVGLLPASDHMHQSKRSKLESIISIDDLPDAILAEILCRLPCNKFVFQCKSVSKRWCTFISDPSFISQFLCLQQERKTPIIRTLLDTSAKEYRITMAAEAGEQSRNEKVSNPLSLLFKRIMSFCSLKEKPFVVATCNDLVLCQSNERDYYICNPYTSQWFALPTPKADEFVRQGFLSIFDSDGYRFKVVGISEECNKAVSFNLKVEIFSSETNEWRDSIVTFTQQIDLYSMNVICCPYNGMLYWTADNFSFGFDPFMINSSSVGVDTIDHYKGRIIEFKDVPTDAQTSWNIDCAGVCGGRLRFIGQFDSASYTLPVWELQEEQRKRVVDRYGTVFLKCTKFSVDREICIFAKRRNMDTHPAWRVFDPNDEDILYVRPIISSVVVLKCNIRTREWSRIQGIWNVHDFLYPLIAQPWWPTPVPQSSSS